MNRFEQELKSDNFVCSECTKCQKLVWPPSEYCNKCFGIVTWRKVSRDATLLEYSCKNGEYFCVAEIEGQIRIIGKISNPSEIKIGQNLTLERCDYEGSEKFIFKIKNKP
ncbi:MAG: hypothetical protein KGH88_07770 [Thaumarchaeota archaeon]|nr:hypothetical protein [Nitrososphaerota archaeon]